MRIKIADGKSGDVIFIDDCSGVVWASRNMDFSTTIPDKDIRSVFDEVKKFIEYIDKDDAQQFAQKMAFALHAIKDLLPKFEHEHIIEIDDRWREQLNLESSDMLISQWIDRFG